MDFLSKLILTSEMTHLMIDLSIKLDDYKAKHPKADISPQIERLKLLDEGIEAIHELYRQRAEIQKENDKLINMI